MPSLHYENTDQREIQAIRMEENMEIRCLKCTGILFKTVLLDDKGHTAIDMTTPAKRERDANDSFFRCQFCGAKNIVIDVKSPGGLLQSRIVR